MCDNRHVLHPTIQSITHFQLVESIINHRVSVPTPFCFSEWEVGWWKWNLQDTIFHCLSHSQTDRSIQNTIRIHIVMEIVLHPRIQPFIIYNITVLMHIVECSPTQDNTNKNRTVAWRAWVGNHSSFIDGSIMERESCRGHAIVFVCTLRWKQREIPLQLLLHY